MLVLIRNILAIALTLATSRAFAQAFGDVTDVGAHPGVTDRVASVVFKIVAKNNVVSTEVAPAPEADFAGTSNREFRNRIVRVDSRVVQGEASNSLMAQDHSAFSINTPTRAINNLLSAVSTFSSSPLSATSTKLMQVLSMLSAGKANMQFAYVAPLSKNTRLESNIDYRLNIKSSNNAAVTARFQYVMDF